MIDQTHVEALYDCDVIDNKGEKIGSVKQVWLDDGTGAPMWAEVHTGLFGMKESFVPIQQGHVAGGAITVPVAKEQVKDAPSVHISDDHMSDEEQEALHRHYGMIPRAKTGEHDRLRGDAAEVTLSEEKLDVGTRNVETGRVRLVKHTVTEQRNVTVGRRARRRSARRPLSWSRASRPPLPPVDGSPAQVVASALTEEISGTKTTAS